MLTFFIFSGCVKDVKDAFDEVSDSIKCLERVQEFDNKNEANPDRPCSDVIADIDEIEKTCSEFISDSSKENFQTLRDACAAQG